MSRYPDAVSARLRGVAADSALVEVEVSIGRVCDVLHMEGMPEEAADFDQRFPGQAGACVIVTVEHRDTHRPLVAAARWNPSVSDGPRWRSLRSVLRKLHRECGCSCDRDGVRW